MARKGYAPDDVDDLLDRVANALDAGESIEELIASADLPIVRRGYDRAQIDAFLERLAPGRRSASATTGPVTESRGLFDFLRR